MHMPLTRQSVTMLGPVLLRRRCPAVPRFDGPALLRDGSLNDHAEHVNILPTMDVVFGRRQ